MPSLDALIAEPITLPVDAVVFRKDLYPRREHYPEVAQTYAKCLEHVPPIEVNQRNELLDGWHRWTAHKMLNLETIRAIVTPTASEAEARLIAIRRNRAHGKQLADDCKRLNAIRLYWDDMPARQIAEELSVSDRTVSDYLSDAKRKRREERQETVRDRWLACDTAEQIASDLKCDKATVSREIEVCCKLEALPKCNKLAAEFVTGLRKDDELFESPIHNYNYWEFVTSREIIDRLLYLTTAPFDIVLDLFAGAGDTIDVCRRRLRRYWVSDRQPLTERAHEIRTLDAAAGLPPLAKRWSDVSLTYLKPPAWEPARASQDDYAAMVAGVVNRVAAKQSHGAIALLTQPSQWTAPDRRYTNHAFDILDRVRSPRLRLENRVHCPLAKETCTPDMVAWARENKECLVITRDLILWTVAA